MCKHFTRNSQNVCVPRMCIRVLFLPQHRYTGHHYGRMMFMMFMCPLIGDRRNRRCIGNGTLKDNGWLLHDYSWLLYNDRLRLHEHRPRLHVDCRLLEIVHRLFDHISSAQQTTPLRRIWRGGRRCSWGGCWRRLRQRIAVYRQDEAADEQQSDGEYRGIHIAVRCCVARLIYFVVWGILDPRA